MTAAWPNTDRWPAERREATADSACALAVGTLLLEFELLGVLGAGGFGIVYLACDRSLQRTVAVKEYFPADFGRRAKDSTVGPRDEADAAMFALGLKSFVREARLLAGFDHPSLVKVHRFWEAHGTAYMVMPHYPGRTLKEVRPTLRGVPDERWLRRLLNPLLAALDLLHRSDVYHRDVSPDNILLLPDDHPILLDFGSARQVAADRTQAITAILKPSFAAIEQYGDVPGLRQGAWTDLYALGGVIHFMITGMPPTPAALRAVEDDMPLLSASGSWDLSPSFLRAVDWALEVDPRHRPQSVDAFRDALHGLASPPASPRAARLTAERGPPEAATAPPNEVHAHPASVSRVSVSSVQTAPPAPRDEPRRMPTRLAAIAGGLALVVAMAVTAALWPSAPQAGVAPAAAASMAPTQTAMPRAEPSPAAVAPVVSSHGAIEPVAPRMAMTDAAITGASARHDAAAITPRHASAKAPVPLPSEPARSPAGKVQSSAPDPVAAPAVANGPRASCGERSYLSMAVCMDRQCQQPAFRSHPQCAEFRRYADARKRSQDQ